MHNPNKSITLSARDPKRFVKKRRSARNKAAFKTVNHANFQLDDSFEQAGIAW